MITYAAATGGGGKVNFDDGSKDTTIYWSTSSDAGASWGSPTDNKGLLFAAWGTVTTQERETLEFQSLPPAP